MNPKILMNAVRNELAQSDAPFLSTTVAAKHPVEQFRHLTHMIGNTSSLSRPKKAIVYANFVQPSFLQGRVRALDLSTLRNGDTSFCTLQVSSTRVRRSVLHRVREGDVAPEEPSALHHPPHYLALEHRVLLLILLGLHHLLLLDPLDSLKSPLLQPHRGLRQWTRISLVTSRLHVDGVHVVFLIRKWAAVVL